MSPIDEVRKWLQELKRRNMTKTQEVKIESQREAKPAAAVEPVKPEPIVQKAKHPRQEESSLRPAAGVDDVREWLAELKRKTIAKRAAQAKEIQKPEPVPITLGPPEISEKSKIVPSPEKRTNSKKAQTVAWICNCNVWKERNMENKGWSVISSENHLPRLWLMLPEGHLLISWETIGKVRASPDFLSISFECEYGVIQINSATTLQELFENLQLEKLRRIDGTKLRIRLIAPA